MRKQLKDLRFPHIHRPLSSAHLFWGLSAALLPLLFSALFFYRRPSLLLMAGVILGAQLGGWVASHIFRKPWAWAEGHDLFLSLVLACLLPLGTSLPGATLGSFGMILFIKEFSGGAGSYLLNPSIAAALILLPDKGTSMLGSAYLPALGITYLLLVSSKRLSWELPWIYLSSLGIFTLLHVINWNIRFLSDAFLLALLSSLDWSTLPIQRRGRQVSLFLAGGLSAWFGTSAFILSGWLAGILLSNIITPWLDERIRSQRFFHVLTRAK